MDEPKRIQRKRVKGWMMPENTVYVGRPTMWGNPFIIKCIDGFWTMTNGAWITGYHTKPEILARCVDEFRKYAEEHLGDYPEWLEPLRGKNLACWCKEGEPCHADVLLELANQ